MNSSTTWRLSAKPAGRGAQDAGRPDRLQCREPARAGAVRSGLFRDGRGQGRSRRSRLYPGAATICVPSTRALLDATLTQNHLDALIRATDDPAFRVDVVKGDNESGPAHPSCPPRRAIRISPCRWGMCRDCRWGFPSSARPGRKRSCWRWVPRSSAPRMRESRPLHLPSLETTPAIAAALAPLPRC